MKGQVLHTVWCKISGEAAGEIWNWSLLGVQGLMVYLGGIVVLTLSVGMAWPSPLVHRSITGYEQNVSRTGECTKQVRVMPLESAPRSNKPWQCKLNFCEGFMNCFSETKHPLVPDGLVRGNIDRRIDNYGVVFATAAYRPNQGPREFHPTAYQRRSSSLATKRFILVTNGRHAFL